MLKRNFWFAGITVIRFGDRLIDVHNSYDLECFGTDISGDTLSLSFSRSRYALDQESLPRNVTLRCTGNLKLALNNLNLIAAPLDFEGIEIAYFDRDCGWDSCIDENMAATQEPLGLHIGFINGLVVRVYCELATLEVD